MQTVHPQYASKAALILAFTLADLAINTIADHDDYTFHGNWYLAVLFRCASPLRLFPGFFQTCRGRSLPPAFLSPLYSKLLHILCCIVVFAALRGFQPACNHLHLLAS